MHTLPKGLVESPHCVVASLTLYERQSSQSRSTTRMLVCERILLTFVDQLEAEQPPLDIHIADLLDLAHPFGTLPCPRAQRIKVKLYVFSHSHDIPFYGPSNTSETLRQTPAPRVNDPLSC